MPISDDRCGFIPRLEIKQLFRADKFNGPKYLETRQRTEIGFMELLSVRVIGN